MRKITKAIGVLACVGILLTGTLSPATADTVNGTITGGVLTATTAGATLTGVTLTGATQTATGTSTLWTITDARGTGAAWTLSVTATAPTSAAGTAETTARVIPVGNLSITPGTVTAGIGADAATGITAPELTFTGSAQALVSAASPSRGTYTLTPTFSLSVPANAYRSNYSAAVGSTPLNPYTSTLTYTIA